MPGSREVQIHPDSDPVSGFNGNSFQSEGNVLFWIVALPNRNGYKSSVLAIFKKCVNEKACLSLLMSSVGFINAYLLYSIFKK